MNKKPVFPHFNLPTTRPRILKNSTSGKREANAEHLILSDRYILSSGPVEKRKKKEQTEDKERERERGRERGI